MSMTSNMVNPIRPGADWKKSIKNNHTITIKSGAIVHKLTKNILGDPKFNKEKPQLGYMEDCKFFHLFSH